MLINLIKSYLKDDDLTIYTIRLDDGQELVITEGEFEQLKKLINEM